MADNIVELLKMNKRIKVVSFDIFDTLLFRTVFEPKDVFEEMYHEEEAIFPAFIKADDWKNARVLAESDVRKKMYTKCGSYEVTLEEIYQGLPTIFSNWRELMELEIRCEKRVCFINESIYDVLKSIRENSEYKIILCSDMYHSSDVLMDILIHNGFDENLVDRIYVSSEHKVSKRYTGLYEKILIDFNIEPQEMLHIGDNYYSDIGVAGALGIHTFFYDLISESMYRYPYLDLEAKLYSSFCKEVYPLRLMASSYCNISESRTEEEKFWFDMGALIYGPFMTYSVEWVLNEAEKNNIKIIRPLMREGAFLSELLNRAAKMRGREYSIEPLYVSRFAVFTALFEVITEKEVEYLASTYNISLSDVFKVLKIEDYMSEYEEYSSYAVNELRTISDGEKSIYDRLLEYLTAHEMMDRIRERNQDSSQLMFDYLTQMGLQEKCITLDLGWRGSMQSAMEKLFKRKGYSSDILHLLLVCNPVVSTSATEGCDIRGYVGNFGSDGDVFLELSARIFELAILNEEGTTIGYAERDGRSGPVTKKIEYPKWQINVMRQLKLGIRSFQDIYHKMISIKPHLVRTVENSVDLCHMIGRLHSFPLAEEARYISQLKYDQNFGANTLTPIIQADMIQKYRETSVDVFYGTFRNAGINWYSGLNVLGDNALFYYERDLQMKRRYMMLSMLYLAMRALKNAGDDKIVLVTAGNMTKIVLKFLAAAGKLGQVAGIVDNNSYTHGSSIAGIKIYPVNHIFECPIYVFTTTREEFYSPLYKQIKDIVGEKIRTIGYFEDNC